jgi:hypothetical protein
MSSMTCTHKDELLALGAIHLLSVEEQTRLDEQISACAACCERWQEYRALATALPQLMRLEIAPSQALNGKAADTSNGKIVIFPTFFESAAEHTEPAASESLASTRPGIGKSQRFANRRLVKVWSVLAAAVMLLSLLGTVWLLMLSHPPASGHHQNTGQSTQTVVLYNPCGNDIAKGVQNAPPACGVVVMDYAHTPALLEEVDPTTGQPLARLKPLQVGNALSAALSADHRTLALGIFPSTNTDNTFIQMVWLDTWTLGAKVSVPLSSTEEGLQDLAISPDGTSIYAVIDSYAGTSLQGSLQYFSSNRQQNTLKFVWRASLPFVSANGMLDDGSFAISADGRTAYLFSAATTPPQLDAIPLQANGLGSPRVLKLPSIATGAQPPFGDETYTYKSGDPIYQWYQPAVLFETQESKLYLVHAVAQDPSKDVLTVIDLPGLTLYPDIPITGEGLPTIPAHLQAGNVALAASAQPTASLAVQQQVNLRPYKGWKPYYGRSEVGATSTDGRWLYLSGSSFAPQFQADGSLQGEQQTGLGLLQINMQTGQVVGRWYTGLAYTALATGQDGRNLYLFGPPTNADPASNDSIDALLVFDTEQGTVISTFRSIQDGWFVLPLP